MQSYPYFRGVKPCKSPMVDSWWPKPPLGFAQLPYLGHLAGQQWRHACGGLVVVAANAGGAWSPIGDVTTTMLWIQHKAGLGRATGGCNRWNRGTSPIWLDDLTGKIQKKSKILGFFGYWLIMMLLESQFLVMYPAHPSSISMFHVFCWTYNRGVWRILIPNVCSSFSGGGSNQQPVYVRSVWN